VIVAAEFLVITHFAVFSLGFGIGFFYLKHKFESSVAGILDFDQGSAGEIEDLLDEFEAEGDKVEN